MEEMDFLFVEQGLVAADRASLDLLRKGARLSNFRGGRRNDSPVHRQLPGRVLHDHRPVYLCWLCVPLPGDGASAETAVRVAAVAFDVRAGAYMSKLIKTLKRNALTIHSAGYSSTLTNTIPFLLTLRRQNA